MDIVLNDGAVVGCFLMLQSRTYDGLLAGVPNKDVNDTVIAQAIDSAADLLHSDCEKVVLIEPKINEGSYNGRNGMVVRYPVLPAIMCMSLFADMDKQLIVVFFQDEMGNLDSNIIEEIKKIDWNSSAEEYCL